VEASQAKLAKPVPVTGGSATGVVVVVEPLPLAGESATEAVEVDPPPPPHPAMEITKSKNTNKMQINLVVLMSSPLFHYSLIEYSAQKKPGLKYQSDISATRLSL